MYKYICTYTYTTEKKFLHDNCKNVRVTQPSHNILAISVLLKRVRIEGSSCWWTYSGISAASGYAGKGGTGGDGDASGTGSIEPGGNVKLSLFFDIWPFKSI